MIVDRNPHEYFYVDSENSVETNFSKLKTIISDVLDPFAINYTDGKDSSRYDNYKFPTSFEDLPKDAVLYIPKGTKNLYEKAEWTKHFSKVIER
jgi:hypothetical protein